MKIKDPVDLVKRYTEGVCHDGAAILDNGQMITITDILDRLNNGEQLQQKADQLESEFKDYQYCMEEMLSHMIDLYNAETTSHYSRLYLVSKLNLSEKLKQIKGE